MMAGRLANRYRSVRDLFFTLTAPEREALEQRRSAPTKIHSCCTWATSAPATASSASSSRRFATTIQIIRK